MKLDKNKFDLILAKWIKWDGELWGELRDIQLKILFERIVKEFTYEQLSKKYDNTPVKIKEIFTAILFKIQQSHGKELSDFIKEIDACLEAKEKGWKEKPDQIFDFEKVFLN